MLEMLIDSVRVSLMNYQRVVILKEKNSKRYLPIWIGPNEADAITVKLQDISVPRPLTHDLLRMFLDILGAKVEYVLISEMAEDTFFAKIFLLHSKGEKFEVDSRPSDAIALAVRTGVSIFVDEKVLDKVGIFISHDVTDEETEKNNVFQGTEDITPTNPEEIKKMSAFKDFINDLDLDDLGRKKR